MFKFYKFVVKMKPLKEMLKRSKSSFCDNLQLHQSLKNTLWSKSATKTVNTSVFSPESKQRATTLLPILPNNTPSNTSQPNTHLASCLVDFRRSSSSKSDRDIPVCVSELQSLLKRGHSVLIDVRSEGETWRTGVIPGSLCVPIHQLETALKMPPEQFLKTYCREKPSTDDHILFICKRGTRAFKSAKIAKELGYENVNSVQEGFLGWLDRQRRIRELQSQAKEVDRESD